MQLKTWNFDKNVSATDMGIVAAKAEKRAREEGKETIFFYGESQILPERIEYFKRRKTTKLADAASPSAGRFQILLVLARLYAELSRLTDTPTNITYYTPGPVSDEPSFEPPAGKSTSLTEEPITPKATSEGSASALSIEETATSSVTLQHRPYSSSNPDDSTPSWLVHSGAMILSDEKPISTRLLRNSRPTPVGSPLLDIKQLGSPPPPKGGYTTFEKELGVNPADIMGSQLDSLSLKEDQPKTTPDPEVGISSPVQSPVRLAVCRSIPSAAATGGGIHKLQDPGFGSEASSASSFALFNAVSSVYPYTEDKMSPMLHVRRVKKIIVNLIHEVEQGQSFEYVISNLRTHPEPFPVGNEPFPDGNDHWIYFHTFLQELAQLYENKGNLLGATLAHGLLQHSCGPNAWSEPRNLGLFKLRSMYNLGRVLEKRGKTQLAEMEFEEALAGFHKLDNAYMLSTQEYSDLLRRELLIVRFPPTLDYSNEGLKARVNTCIESFLERCSLAIVKRSIAVLEKLLLATGIFYIERSSLQRMGFATEHLREFTMQDAKFELIMLAISLSARGEFDTADLIYQFATSEMHAHSIQLEPLHWAQIYRDQTKHYQMQGKWTQSLSSINSAFLSLATVAKIDGTTFHVLMAEINDQFDNASRHLLVADNQSPSWYEESVGLRNAAARARALHLASTNTSPETASNGLKKTTNYMSSAMKGKPKTTNNVFKPTNVAPTSIKAEPEATSDGLKTARRTVLKKMQRIREAIGDWVLPNDDDGFSSGWTTSTRSHKYGVTYSASEVTGVSNSVYMVP
jgi:tetratricopeptide (TPR) repeat protein